jgi:hypothetical protein
MAYLGAAPQPGISFSGVQTQSFNGNGSTVEFALSRHVAQATNLEVIVNNVQQSPFDGSYSVVGGYTLTFSEAPSSGTNNIYVVYRDYSVETIVDTTAYRSNEVDSLLAAKVNKAGDTMSGRLDIHNSTETGYASNISESVSKSTLSLRPHTTDSPRISMGSLASGVVGNTSAGSAYIQRGNSSSTWDLYLQPFGGRVLMPNQPAFCVDGSSDNYSGIYLTNPSIRLNKGSHFNNINGRFTVPVNGVYFFSHNLSTEDTNAHFIEIHVNGSNYTQRQLTYNIAYQSGTLCNLIQLSAGDYVQAARRSTGYQVYSSCFTGYLIG